MKTNTPKRNTAEMVAAACYAYRVKGNEIVREDQSARPEWKDHDGTSIPATPEVKSNKRVALDALVNSKITDADREHAAEAIEHIQSNLTMNLLAGKKVGTFIQDLAKELEQEELPEFKLGILVYVPNVYATAKVKEAITEKVSECMYSSQSLGADGRKVTVSFTLIEKRFLQAYGCYSAFGKDEAGNLISFLTQHEELCESGKRVGKIKKSDHDKWHNNAIVTSLNYVKACS